VVKGAHVAPNNVVGRLCVFGIVIMKQNYNLKKQKNVLQNFQNEMCFLFLHYTSKNEKKGHECCQNKNIASF